VKFTFSNFPNPHSTKVHLPIYRAYIAHAYWYRGRISEELRGRFSVNVAAVT